MLRTIVAPAGVYNRYDKGLIVVSKHCETFEHTADIGLAARADTLGELFEALAEGLARLICPHGPAVAQRRSLSVQAEDVEALAVDFLAAVLNAIQTDKFIVAAVCVRKITATDVRAELLGDPYDAERHRLETEVKAVTYHQLKITREAGRWLGRVILDV